MVATLPVFHPPCTTSRRGKESYHWQGGQLSRTCSHIFASSRRVPESSALSVRRESKASPRAASDDEVSDKGGSPSPTANEPLPVSVKASNSPNRMKAESTDWVATQLTRRFGIAGGLVWFGFLTFGVVSEQLKTRFEIATEESGQKNISKDSQKEIETPEGLRYVDMRIGGGSFPAKGLLVVLHFRAYADGELNPDFLQRQRLNCLNSKTNRGKRNAGELFEDTYARGKPIVYTYGIRPHPGGTCAGVEMALSSMRAGGIRKVTVPPDLGFGRNGTSLRPTEHVPGKAGEVAPGATLTYELELVRVSVPPS
jgi:FKBP-type peptidyl-prolyl cis-trans isomerase